MATTTTDHKTGRFVVLTSAITFRAGTDKNNVIRARRGQVVELSTQFTDVRRLLDLKAIAKATVGKTYKATTADIARHAAGASDDPVAPPVQDIQPLTPEDARQASDDETGAGGHAANEGDA